MLPSDVVTVLIASVAATLLMLAALAGFMRHVRLSADRWGDTKVRLFFSARYTYAGALSGFGIFFILLLASLLTAHGRAADVLRLSGLFVFVVLSWIGLFAALCVHFSLKAPEPDPIRPYELAKAAGDPTAHWPDKPAFAYPRSRLAEGAVRRRLTGTRDTVYRRSLGMTGDGVYVFAGHKPERFVPWTEVAAVSEIWIDDRRHELAPRDVTIDLREGRSLLIATGLAHRGRALALLLLHARNNGIPLRAVDRRAETLQTAERIRPAEAAAVLRRTGVVVEIAAFWPERWAYDRTAGAPRA